MVSTDFSLGKQKEKHPLRALTFFVCLVLALAIIAHRAVWRFTEVSFPAQVVGTEFEVSARSGGTIRRILVEPNGKVRKGDVLAELHDETAAAEIQAASEELTKIQEALATARSDATLLLKRFEIREKIAEASAELSTVLLEVEALRKGIATASESLTLIRDRKDRAESLYRQKAFALADLEERGLELLEQELALQTAGSELEQKESRIESLLGLQRLYCEEEANLISETDKFVTDLELALRKKEGELNTLLASQSERIVRSEREGTVAKISKAVGESISAGEPLVRISTGERIWVETYLNSERVNQIQEGDRVYVQVQTSSYRKRYPAVVKGVLPIMQSQPGYRPGPFEESTERVGVALVEFEDPEQAKRELRPGQRVKTVLIGHSGDKSVVALNRPEE